MSRSPIAPTVQELRSWPVTVPLAQAGRCWRMGRERAYRMAAAGEFPVPVLRLGRRLVVTRAAILAALGIADPDADSSNGHLAAVATDARADAQLGAP